MEAQTTMRIFKSSLPWIKKCCEAYSIGTAEFIEKFEMHTKAKKLQAFYDSLPKPTTFIQVKKLERVKLKPYKICIQTGSAT